MDEHEQTMIVWFTLSTRTAQNLCHGCSLRRTPNHRGKDAVTFLTALGTEPRREIGKNCRKFVVVCRSFTERYTPGRHSLRNTHRE
jgi:hypothetical protein